MDLELFLPHKIALLSDAISRSLAQIYSDRFGLSRDEFRLLTALNHYSELSMSGAAQYTTVDNMQLTRVATKLEVKGFVNRKSSKEDRRSKLLCLTGAGIELLKEVETVVLAREKYLFSPLSEEQRAALETTIEIIAQRANDLSGHG